MTYQFQLAELLIEEGADVNVIAKDGKTPAFYACEEGNKRIAEMISKSEEDQKKDFLYKNTDDRVLGNIELVELLLAKGASIEAKERERLWTPLHVAAVKGEIELVKLLLAKGVDRNSRDEEGNTPLDLAKKK